MLAKRVWQAVAGKDWQQLGQTLAHAVKDWHIDKDLH
jgi:hypothetical protein